MNDVNDDVNVLQSSDELLPTHRRAALTALAACAAAVALPGRVQAQSPAPGGAPTSRVTERGDDKLIERIKALAAENNMLLPKGPFFVAAATEKTPKEYAPFAGAWGVTKGNDISQASRMVLVEAIDDTGSARVLLFFSSFVPSPSRPQDVTPASVFYVKGRIASGTLEFATGQVQHVLRVGADRVLGWESVFDIRRNRYSLQPITP
jgi:hypothetical protein